MRRCEGNDRLLLVGGSGIVRRIRSVDWEAAKDWRAERKVGRREDGAEVMVLGSSGDDRWM